MKKLFIVFLLMLSILDANIDDAKKVYYAKDFKKAFPMFEQLSKEGNIESNYYLGLMYYFDFGVKKNYDKAFEYLIVASSLPNKKNLKFIVNMALMYIDGEETKQDYVKALSLLKIADKENIGFAQDVLGILYENGYGVKKDFKKAIIYYEKGCKNQYPKSCYSAGDYYEKGIAVEENYETAKKYYKKACEAGIEESCEAIKNMKEPLSFFQKYLSFTKKYFYHIMIIILFLYLIRIIGEKLIKKYRKKK